MRDDGASRSVLSPWAGAVRRGFSKTKTKTVKRVVGEKDGICARATGATVITNVATRATVTTNLATTIATAAVATAVATSALTAAFTSTALTATFATAALWPSGAPISRGSTVSMIAFGGRRGPHRSGSRCRGRPIERREAGREGCLWPNAASQGRPPDGSGG